MVISTSEVLRYCSSTHVISVIAVIYSVQQHRVPKMLPLFPVEYVRNCSTIHFLIPQGRREIKCNILGGFVFMNMINL